METVVKKERSFSTKNNEKVENGVSRVSSDEEINRLNQELLNSQKCIKKTETTLKRTQTISTKRLQEIKILKKRISDFENSVLNLKQSLTEQLDKLSDAENLIESYESKIENLLKQNKELDNRLLKTVTQKKQLEREKAELEHEVLRLESEIERIKSSPLLLGTVIKALPNNRVAVRSSAGPQFIVSALPSIDEEELAPGTNVGMNQQTFSIVAIYPVFEEPNVAAMELIESSNVTYEDIGGLDEQIGEIREVVELPLLKPHLFKEVGIEPPNGALLYGPPGTGKTMISKAVANHTNATFIHVVGSELVQKYIGDGAKMVHDLFEMAKERAPSIIFIDEIDSIASKRVDETTGADREIHRTLMQLLAEMDGFMKLEGVKIIGATNRIDILDSAILRPGRFDRLIYVPLPDEQSREKIMSIHVSKMNLRNINLNEIAKQTEGASGADLKAIATEAGMFAIRSNRNYVLKEDFNAAVEKIMKKKNEDTNLPVPENMFL
ncbi:MAG: proteasome-activating nucleotidase [Methanosarcinaceae archaeon]|nr:proteasome-activating nucleotidase [Methanosarcinaceae archaeon]